MTPGRDRRHQQLAEVELAVVQGAGHPEHLGAGRPELLEQLTGYLRRMTSLLEERPAPSRSGLSPHQLALAVTALSVGGLVLARAVADPQLSNEILKACRRLAAAEVEEQP